MEPEFHTSLCLRGNNPVMEWIGIRKTRRWWFSQQMTVCSNIVLEHSNIGAVVYAHQYCDLFFFFFKDGEGVQFAGRNEGSWGSTKHSLLQSHYYGVWYTGNHFTNFNPHRYIWDKEYQPRESWWKYAHHCFWTKMSFFAKFLEAWKVDWPMAMLGTKQLESQILVHFQDFW